MKASLDRLMSIEMPLRRLLLNIDDEVIAKSGENSSVPIPSERVVNDIELKFCK